LPVALDLAVQPGDERLDLAARGAAAGEDQAEAAELDRAVGAERRDQPAFLQVLAQVRELADRHAAALFLSLLNAAPSAKEPAANAAAQVRVFPDHYIAAGKRFAGLDDLDGWVRSGGARSLEFHARMWTANERLTAAIERFQHVYVDVRWTAPGKSGCPAVAGEKAASAR
jgi:hypothetical protein